MAYELWTEVTDPASLTGFVRNYMADAIESEKANNSLLPWFPTVGVDDIRVSLTEVIAQRTEMAQNRAWDAGPSRGDELNGKKRVFELPAISHAIRLTEYAQIIARKSDNEYILERVFGAAKRAVDAITETLEYQRGIALTTGKYVTWHDGKTVVQEDWGRDASMQVVAPKKWTESGVSILDELRKYTKAYEDKNGVKPGALLVSPKVSDIILAAAEFRTNLNNGGYIISTMDQVNSILVSRDIPPLTVYNRRVSKGGALTSVLEPSNIYLLPAAGNPVGATLYAPTLSATSAGWSQADAQGVYAGLYRNTTLPMGAEVVADAVAMPALAAPNATFTATVL